MLAELVSGPLPHPNTDALATSLLVRLESTSPLPLTITTLTPLENKEILSTSLSALL